MMKLYDFVCGACGHCFEELVGPDESPPPCEACQQTTTKDTLSYHPTNPPDPHWAEIFMKGRNIRNKHLGKVPWRRNSWSQSD